VKTWSQADAIALCVMLESVVPEFGAHVALTGGNLYKTGERKDADVLFYRIRQQPQIKMEQMWKALEAHGFYRVSGFGWCHKATCWGRSVDCFFPEAQKDENGNEIEYNSGEELSDSDLLKELFT
jgi:hypothetical protein